MIPKLSKQLKKIFFTALLLVSALQILMGCTAMVVADRVIPKEPQDLPSDIRIDVPFFAQTENYCGPASLAMVANYYGNNVTPNEVANLVYIPEKKGSLQTEMVAASRSLDLVAFVMHMDDESLRAEIDAERPVIVLQNLALNIYPIWHYSVVTGRDPNNEHLLLHSGRHEYYRVPWTTFSNTWKRSKNWALIAAPAGDLPTSATASVVLKAALNLEKVGKYRAAQLTYAAATERWPNNFAAHVGLANTHMRLREPLAASQAYQSALKLNKRSSAVLNNFAYSAYDLGCEVTAIQAASCALKLDQKPNQEIAATLHELKQKTNMPSNHPNCPRIRCDIQTLAASDLN